MFIKGSRVQLHPACDEWMQGDRFGTVIGFGRTRVFRPIEQTEYRFIRVRLDRSGRERRFHPDNLIPLPNME